MQAHKNTQDDTRQYDTVPSFYFEGATEPAVSDAAFGTSLLNALGFGHCRDKFFASLRTHPLAIHHCSDPVHLARVLTHEEERKYFKQQEVEGSVLLLQFEATRGSIFQATRGSRFGSPPAISRVKMSIRFRRPNESASHHTSSTD